MSPRVPPHNAQAESNVLGAMLLSREAVDEVIGTLHAGDFYTPAHATIYQAILDVHGQGHPVDATTVTDHLRRSGLIREGMDHAIVDALANVPSTRSVSRYAGIVAEMSLLRGMIGVAAEITELGYGQPGDVAAVVDQAEQLIYRLAQQRRDQREAISLADNVDEWLRDIEQLYERGPDHGAAVSTGIRDLDQKLHGLRPGQLIVAAGRPGMGKSLLGGQVAVHASLMGHKAMVVSVEMSAAELVGRFVTARSRIDPGRLRSGRLLESDWPKLRATTDQLAAVPLWVLDDPTASVPSIRAQARRQKARHGLDLIVVDYLQLLQAETRRRDNRQVEVSEMSAGLKRLARDLDVPVIALAQLNRGLEMRGDKRPQLADLRESGAIENDADVVIGIYRDDYYEPNSPDRGTAELIILKQRNGPTGTVKVSYLPDFGVFADMARI